MGAGEEVPVSSVPPHKVALALQGGGSHGAFTWGVLDRLLLEPTIAIDGVTGTSAGAMNAVVLAHGLAQGGPAGARHALRQFWESIGEAPGLASFLAPLTGQIGGKWSFDDSPAYVWFDLISRVLSPYDLNPLNYHPLRSLLAKQVDFERLRRPGAIATIVCATNVHTGRRRVFANKEISVDAVLASACLPFLFPAVEIDGEPYWDGGYTGNPAIAPVYRDMGASDLIVVGINPYVREETPRSANEIIDRVNEISFNATFWMELTAIALLTHLRDEGSLDSALVRPLRFHNIYDPDLRALGASSKMNNHPAFLEHLFAIGTRAADAWLSRHRDAIGKQSTVDLKQLLPIDLFPPKASSEPDDAREAPSSSLRDAG